MFRTLFLFLLFISSNALAFDLPEYAVEKECTKLAEYGGDYSSSLFNSCIKLEQRTYEEVNNKWEGLSTRIKKHCNDLALFGGGGSYQMLGSCIKLETKAENNKKSFSFKKPKKKVVAKNKPSKKTLNLINGTGLDWQAASETDRKSASLKMIQALQQSDMVKKSISSKIETELDDMSAILMESVNVIFAVRKNDIDNNSLGNRSVKKTLLSEMYAELNWLK